MISKQEMQTALLRILPDLTDSVFCNGGFVRKSTSSKYVRKMSDVVQEVDFIFDFRPSANPEAIADLLPNLTVFFPEVSRVALEMVDGDVKLLANAPEITLRQQFHIAAPGGKPTYWHLYGDDRDRECIESVRTFTESWVLPLLNELMDVNSITRAYESDDERILKQRHFFIYVAAAYVLLNCPEKAGQVLEEKFGRPGARRKYAKAFAYIDQLLAE